MTQVYTQRKRELLDQSFGYLDDLKRPRTHPEHYSVGFCGNNKRSVPLSSYDEEVKRPRFQQPLHQGRNIGTNPQSQLDMSYINTQIERVERNVQDSINILQELYALKETLQPAPPQIPTYFC
jgi:hypothetical protein